MRKEKETNETDAAPPDSRHRTFTVIGIVFCVILIPILLINCILIVKSFVRSDQVPGIGGYVPLIVLTDSMYPEIKSGDLIICHTVDSVDVKVGDVISFFDPEGNGTSVVTHRVTEVFSENGSLYFRTKGDANNTADRTPVPEQNLVGVFRTRIPGVGSVSMFMQTVPGLIVCIGCPLALLIVYDILRRRRYDADRKRDTEALLAELERLKAERRDIPKEGSETDENSDRTDP